MSETNIGVEILRRFAPQDDIPFKRLRLELVFMKHEPHDCKFTVNRGLNSWWGVYLVVLLATFT